MCVYKRGDIAGLPRWQTFILVIPQGVQQKREEREGKFSGEKKGKNVGLLC